MTSQYIEGKHIINSYTTSTLKDSISLQSKIIKKKDTRETRRTINKKSIKKFKIITQIHSKLEKKKQYIKKQKIQLDINMTDVIFSDKDVSVDIMDIDIN
jgi:hypothetical protein